MHDGLVRVVAVEVHHHDHRIRLAGTGKLGRGLAQERHHARIVARQDVQVVVAAACRMLGTDFVERGEQLGDAVLVGLVPIAHLDFVLLVVDLLFESRTLLVLDELIAVVDAPARRAHRGEHRAHRVTGDTVVAQVGGHDVRRGRPEGVVLVETTVAVGLLQILLKLLLGVAPREVAVRLREAGIAQRAHHARTGERLGQEQRLRMLLRHGGDHVLPETHRLGMRVVHAEDRHAGLDPQVHDAFGFRFDAFHVGVEIDRIDVLVLLRRILGECDRSVRLGAEPVRMLFDPRVVRRALQREVERHFDTQLVRVRAERLEIVHGAEQRVDGVVAAQLGADAERGARIVRSGNQRVVAALAAGHANREDRRQVHDVEAFGLRAVEAGQRRLQRALHDLAVGVEIRAFGTREELVPCGEARLRTLHAEALRIRRAQAVAQRIGFMQACDCVGGRCGKTRGRVERLVGNGLRGFAQRLLVIGGQLGIACASPTFQQLRAGFQRVLHIVADLDLDLRVVQPGSVRIFPAFDHDVPFAELLLDVGIAIFPRLQVAVVADLDHRFPAVQAGVGAGHGEAGLLGAARVAHGHGGTGLGAAFDEHLRGDLECLAKLHASRVQAVFGGRSDAKNVYAAELFRAGAVDDRCWSFADGSLRCGFRLGSALGGWFFGCRLCG